MVTNQNIGWDTGLIFAYSADGVDYPECYARISAVEKCRDMDMLGECAGIKLDLYSNKSAYLGGGSAIGNTRADVLWSVLGDVPVLEASYKYLLTLEMFSSATLDVPVQAESILSEY